MYHIFYYIVYYIEHYIEHYTEHDIVYYSILIWYYIIPNCIQTAGDGDTDAAGGPPFNKGFPPIIRDFL